MKNVTFTTFPSSVTSPCKDEVYLLFPSPSVLSTGNGQDDLAITRCQLGNASIHPSISTGRHSDDDPAGSPCHATRHVESDDFWRTALVAPPEAAAVRRHVVRPNSDVSTCSL
jgi:hypothetical protein